ncbi:MAG: type III-B CRISPR-associated protein Cas10/Cmr2 [Isosphaerales bacterium]
MSHLLAISIGPVQEFIAAARRTRDLWFGSYLLSEVSRAVAIEVENQGSALIFPASSKADNVANVILAELGAGDPKEVAAMAKEAAQNRWLKFVEDARVAASGVIREEIWKDQEADVIEFYAAWVPHTDPKNYRDDRARVMRLLAGRKNCRDFKQPRFNDAGLPKSSLDGQRPTVLVGPRPGESRETYRDNWPKKLRLSPGEQLDVVGVTKRLGKKTGEDHPRYPSVARVAAETWLQGLQSRDRDKLQRLKDACQKLESRGLNTVREEKYQYFPYEGTVIYKDRHTDLKKELGLGDGELAEIAAALKNIGGEPNPYLAALVADGDKMGAALSKLESVEAHRMLSGKLATFASGAKAIVAAHSGVLVYAGGDDVLAFVPVHTCLNCARALRDRLRRETGMSLSVGVAIGHFMENLEDLRDYGQFAEKAAKAVEGKDALAVHLHKRGGSPIHVRGRWSDNPDERLTKFAELMNQGIIPTKLPYELRDMAKLYEPWKDKADSAIRMDLIRLIAKKQSRGVDTVKEALDGYLHEMNSAKLLSLAVELLVARQLATALRQAGEGPARVAEVPT